MSEGETDPANWRGDGGKSMCHNHTEVMTVPQLCERQPTSMPHICHESPKRAAGICQSAGGCFLHGARCEYCYVFVFISAFSPEST